MTDIILCHFTGDQKHDEKYRQTRAKIIVKNALSGNI